MQAGPAHEPIEMRFYGAWRQGKGFSNLLVGFAVSQQIEHFDLPGSEIAEPDLRRGRYGRKDFSAPFSSPSHSGPSFL
jgi:hypothetical protein